MISELIQGQLARQQYFLKVKDSYDSEESQKKLDDVYIKINNEIEKSEAKNGR